MATVDKVPTGLDFGDEDEGDEELADIYCRCLGVNLRNLDCPIHGGR